MSSKEAYEKKMRAQLDGWSAEIDRLRAKAEGKEADAQLEYRKQIEELRRMQDAAKARLAEFRSAGDDAWEDLKSGIDDAWTSLGAAVKRAVSRFQRERTCTTVVHDRLPPAWAPGPRGCYSLATSRYGGFTP